MFFCSTLENMARRSSGVSGFIEQERLLSDVIESEDASKCYSFLHKAAISKGYHLSDSYQIFILDSSRF